MAEMAHGHAGTTNHPQAAVGFERETIIFLRGYTIYGHTAPYIPMYGLKVTHVPRGCEG